MAARKNITIYDIAREAGVSPATVSRIITGSTSVRQEKRDKVNWLIEKYNFRPNAMARALTETRTRVIGMLLADTGNPYYNSVFAACGNEAFKRGYVTMLLNTHSRADMEESGLTKLREQRVDAIIICGGRIDLAQPDPAFMQLLETTIETTPIVVGSRSPMERIPGVAVDHKGSVDLALSKDACAHKRFDAPGAGDADLLLVTNYEMGTAIYKTAPGDRLRLRRAAVLRHAGEAGALP